MKVMEIDQNVFTNKIVHEWTNFTAMSSVSMIESFNRKLGESER